MTWKNVVVEEIVDDCDLLAEMTPDLRTLGLVIYTKLPIRGSAFCNRRLWT